MRFPPSIMRLYIKNRNHNINLWLPLFLVWLLLAVVFIILLPFILICAIVICCLGWGSRLQKGISALFEIFGSLRELEIDVEQENEKVFIYFI